LQLFILLVDVDVVSDVVLDVDVVPVQQCPLFSYVWLNIVNSLAVDVELVLVVDDVDVVPVQQCSLFGYVRLNIVNSPVVEVELVLAVDDVEPRLIFIR